LSEKLSKRPVAIIVRDGWGENPYPEWDHANAIKLADTPVDDALRSEYPWSLIRTSGEDVGLPASVMGNSEVGHQNIGAGRIVDQELMRITRLLRSGELFRNPTLLKAMERAKAGGRIHFMGLASSAGVHSDLAHLYGLLEFTKKSAVPAESVFVHLFTDGRDSPPNAGIDFCREIESEMKRIGVGRIASVVGRYYAMDRDNRWDRVEKAYQLLTQAVGRRVPSAEEAFLRYYKNPTELSRSGDEFIEPSVVVDELDRPIATIKDGDAVVFFNFRGDRPRELSLAFVADQFPFIAKRGSGEGLIQGFERPKKLDLFFVTLTEYQQDLPVQVAIPKAEKMTDILGAYVSKLGLTQFRCAETEKFPHVTFFFNDYRETPFEGEDRQIVPSPRDVTTYDQKPEMSAVEVTEEMLNRINRGKYDLYILNYANGDMVGHTGSLPAAVKAVETVDRCVGLVVDAILAKGGAAIVTADHGNCEQMIDPATGGPHTSHTTYDVPLYVVCPEVKGRTLLADGRLADIAPTALALLGLEKPEAMTGRSLLGAQ
jgi:2,3-bisphosphoglycerate-independent phosphoglycerate mutase